jgi:peptide/nickel transport system substrate-binding protein
MKRFSISVLTLSLLALTGCAQHARFGNDPPINYPVDHTKAPVVQAGKYGGSMTGTFLGDPKTLNVWVADDADSGALAGELYDSLEARDGFTLRYVPRLAYLPKISKDGLTYTYTLRPNLKWSDGVPLTTDDVIFTLNVLFDPNTETLSRESMLVDVNQPDGTVKRVPFKWVKVDDRTVKFILPVKWAPAEEMFGFAIAPKHCLEKIYKSGHFNQAYGVDTPPSQLVGCGPFLMTEYKPGQRVVFKRNPLYWKYSNNQKLPYLDTFNYLILPDANDMVLNFRAGDSDTLTIPDMEYPPVAKYAKRDNYTVAYHGPDWGFSYLCFNLNPHAKLDKRLLKIFSDVRFRQACSYAIDRQGYCSDVLFGLAHPLYGPETPADVYYYDPRVKQYPYDPEKARQLLLSMGMTEGPNGMMLYGGKPVTFNILTNAENPARRALSTVVANELQSIGIDAKFTPINFNALVTRIDAPPYEWEAHILGFTGGPEPNDGGDLWRTTGADHEWSPKQNTPATAWEARIDRDFTNGAHELDPAKRRKFYNDWQETLGIEQPMIFLDYGDQYSAVRNHFGNIEPSSLQGLGGDVYWNLEEIYDTHAVRLTP